ncbi:uncharacterized protein [Euwallacea fornicatus]|uniref:uncharacterized protein n=1 Tax=Euwallacea fornicatus TaxID=995702 RepID=UPI00338D9FBA
MEDVTSLTKEEFLKFLNCSHHSIKQEVLTVEGPRNTTTKVVKQFGSHSACNIKLEEWSLNKQILRIPLPKVDIGVLTPKQVALKFRTQKAEKKRKRNNVIVSRFGRKLKKKELNILSLTSQAASKNSLKPKVKKPIGIFQKSIVPLKKTKGNTLAPQKKMASSISPVRQYPGALSKKPQCKFIFKYVPNEPTFFLKMTPQRHTDDGKLKYPFDTLVKDIKNMKLPSPTWKIKVVVKSNKIASIIFTNKCVLERTVSFNAKSEYYEVMIENRPAILLGAPNEVICVEDIEILLNIIHTISAKNPMVCYKN